MTYDQPIDPVELKDPVKRREFDEQVKRILASKPFRGDQLPALLKTLIEHWETGQNPTQQEIEHLIWGQHGPNNLNAVNALMERLRNALRSYCDGRSDSIVISCPVTEARSRTKWIEIKRRIFVPEPQRDIPLWEVIIIRGWPVGLAVALIVVVVLCLRWVPIHKAGGASNQGTDVAAQTQPKPGGTCDSSIAITNLKDHDPVGSMFFLRASRSAKTPAGCFDYVIVEATKTGRRWVEGQLDPGDEPALHIYFGDPDTPSETPYAVYIWSTSSIMEKREINSNSSPPADVKRSKTVEVTLKK